MPPNLPFRAEYATSARDQCGKCGGIVPEDAVLIGIMQQSMFDDCLQPEWYDMNCFFEIRRSISEDYIDGFANLRYRHQILIREKLGYDVNGASTEEQPPTKRLKLNKLELEKQIEIQNNEFFVVYDKLKSLKEGSGVCRVILRANNQFVPNCYAQMLIHLTDVLYFGALAPCPVCKDGKLVFRNSVYCCTGFDSLWSSCTYTVREPQRIPVEIPEKYEGTRFGTDFEMHTRILRDVTKFKEEEFEMYTKQPLFGLDFCIIGETSMRRKEIENKVEAMGGKITTKVYANLAAVISNAEEVKNFSGLMTEASFHGIQVVPHSFLSEVMDSDPVEVIVKNDLSGWGENPKVRIPERSFSWNRANTNERLQNDSYSSLNVVTVHKEVVLNFVDISLNRNTYFKLQLLETSHEPSKYTIIESMGRNGTSIGTTNQKDFRTLDFAQNVFKNIYFEKTGNKFNTSEFVKNPRLFNHVQIDNESLAEVKQRSQNNWPATKLDKPLFDLMKLMYDDEKVFKSTLLEYCFDLESMPLGKLAKAQIQDAMNILGEILSILNTGNQQRTIALSNQFYSNFPHNFGYHRIPIIDTCEMVQEKMDMLHNLMQKQQRYEFLISKLNREENLLDLCYAQLKDFAEITMLNKSSGMYTQICNYIKNTQLRSDEKNADYSNSGALELDEVFEVSRHEDVIRYAPHETNFNRQLLLYGSPGQNIADILTNGLKTSPSNDVFDNFGRGIFGRGIYFTDSVSKSITHSIPGRSGFRLVLLCEVAAGITDTRYKHDNDQLMGRYETVLVAGQYQPVESHIRPDGLKIPNGMLTQREKDIGNMFNEFVVFDESRVKIRYLVKLKQSGDSN